MRFIKGYRIIDIPLSESGGSVHSLYVKAHADRSKQDSNGRVLFVGNVDYTPAMSHESIDLYLRQLLGRFGDINGVSVSAFNMDEGANTRFAHVEFAKKQSIKLVMSNSDADYHESGLEIARTYGYGQLIQTKTASEIKKMFSFIDENPEELLEEVNSYMKDFEEQEALAKLEKERLLNEADEDGFMPVKNRNKRKRVVEERRGSGNKRERKPKKPMELKNFYRFQIREDKMKQLETLRKKFEEDKERVAKMKEQRKFKPF